MRVYWLTGGGHAAGRSVTAFFLGWLLAQRGARVLVVERSERPLAALRWSGAFWGYAHWDEGDEGVSSWRAQSYDVVILDGVPEDRVERGDMRVLGFVGAQATALPYWARHVQWVVAGNMQPFSSAWPDCVYLPVLSRQVRESLDGVHPVWTGDIRWYLHLFEEVLFFV